MNKHDMAKSKKFSRPSRPQREEDEDAIVCEQCGAEISISTITANKGLCDKCKEAEEAEADLEAWEKELEDADDPEEEKLEQARIEEVLKKYRG